MATQEQSVLLKVLSIDAWNEGDVDGYPYNWVWNQWFFVGTIDLEDFENLSCDAEVIQYFINEGYLNDGVNDLVSVEDDGYNIVVMDAEDFRPLFAIEYGPAY